MELIAKPLWGLALCSALDAAATAHPQRLSVEPIVVVAEQDSRAADQLRRALKALNARGDLHVDAGKTRVVQVPAGCLQQASCTARILPERTSRGRVMVIAHDPGWRPSDHEVRCVGPDPLRARSVRVHLRDAILDVPAISNPQLSILASCISGALNWAREVTK
jgi:hypothetical protein